MRKESQLVTYKNSPLIISLSQDTESQVTIMGQDLPIYYYFFFFPYCLGRPSDLSAAWVCRGAHDFCTPALARWGFLWQNKKAGGEGSSTPVLCCPPGFFTFSPLCPLLLLPKLMRGAGVESSLEFQEIIQVEGDVGVAGLAGRVMVYGVNPCLKAI